MPNWRKRYLRNSDATHDNLLRYFFPTAVAGIVVFLVLAMIATGWTVPQIGRALFG